MYTFGWTENTAGSQATGRLFHAILIVCIATFIQAANAQESQKDEVAHGLPDYIISTFGHPPDVPNGALDQEIINALDTAFGDTLLNRTWGEEQETAFNTLAESQDPRLAWLISDMMRIAASPTLNAILSDAASKLLDIGFEDSNYWGRTVDHLIAWDIPAPPDYLKYKRNVYTIIVPEWDKLFVEGDIDWRHVSWGGVRIDDRAYDTTDEPCNCIPAADNPEVTTADDAQWLKDDDIVFGVAVNGEYRAYPRRIMEVREMVNDTLGGRSLGIPYCTLCGAAQAYFTDDVADGVDRPILRTSGLLIRSNKVMYDLNTYSVFDTFRGHAVTGPLHDKGVKLQQASVVTTEWGGWKAAHPDTTVLKESLALGRDFDFRSGRDANGPIFPVGDVDPRLSVHDDVVGVISPSGTPLAFHLEQALLALDDDQEIKFDGVQLVRDGSGIRAVDDEGRDLGSHQAFWFAWSQFHPETQLWAMN